LSERPEWRFVVCCHARRSFRFLLEREEPRTCLSWERGKSPHSVRWPLLHLCQHRPGWVRSDGEPYTAQPSDGKDRLCSVPDCNFFGFLLPYSSSLPGLRWHVSVVRVSMTSSNETSAP